MPPTSIAKPSTGDPCGSVEIELSRPTIGEEEIASVASTLRSGWLIEGPRVAELEQALEARLAPAHVRCLNSATAALMLALRLVGVERGSEVVLPSLTFAACANVVEHLGATPVLVDSEPATGLIDLDAAERAIGPRTRAIMPVHLGGRPVDLGRVAEIRDRHGIAVVEDAAHAIGAEWGGRPVGSHGNAVAFSFHASKNMTTGEGGALAVADPDMAGRIERLRVQGLSRSSWSRHGSDRPADYELEEPGYKFAMSDLAAAIGVPQLRRLDAWIERRHELACLYDELLRDVELELEPPLTGAARHAHHVYAVRLRRELPVSRTALVRHLANRGIGTSVHFKPIHRFEYYSRRYDLRDSELPVASDFADRTLSLPLHPGMADNDVRLVAEAIVEALSGPSS